MINAIETTATEENAEPLVNVTLTQSACVLLIDLFATYQMPAPGHEKFEEIAQLILHVRPQIVAMAKEAGLDQK